jgi:hypothetical protein
MPLQATSGAASYDAFGGGVALKPNYIEDVFSTWLYTGSGAAQTITNGIDLSTKGGLVWQKSRNLADSHYLVDTVRGSSKYISTESTVAQATSTALVNSFNTNGFTTGNNYPTNYTVASWTFRKQPKFFDVQTFTYPLSGSITVNHNLGSTPGCVMVKVTDGVDGWYVYHRMANNGTNPSNYILQLNTTGAQINNFASWITVGSTSITFPSGALNPGSNFVMYLFAHDAGGFGLTGTDNVISCGSYTGNGGLNSINLGYEAQYVLIKSTGVENWVIYDNMRGMAVSTGGSATLYANLSNAEATGVDRAYATATGFAMNTSSSQVNTNGQTYIYIAIRRGPMKVPTSGTSVFDVQGYTGAPNKAITTGFPSSLVIERIKNLVGDTWVFDRLRGGTASNWVYLKTNDTTAESTGSGAGISFATNTGYVNNWDTSGSVISWAFQRAPSFFDEVCYDGNFGGPKQFSHNLSVVPELMIVKIRTGASAYDWIVYHKDLGNTSYIALNSTAAKVTGDASVWSSTTPTSTVFSVGTSGSGNYAPTNANGYTYVNYLFATCAGVSKVGSYTGNGSSQTINCGFTSGARFVLIKRTDSTGDWYVWDTARGMVAGTDPSLLLNSTAAEVNANSIYTTTGGFQIVSTAAGINASGGTYIFLAIA